MTQLELFDEIDEEKFALSLTNTQLYDLRKSNPEAHHWIKQIRDAVKEYQAKVNHFRLVYEEKIYRAKYGRGQYQLDRFPGW